MTKGKWARKEGGHLVDEDEDGLLGRELDPFADDVDELADRQVLREEPGRAECESRPASEA